jgi:hypothetical protein
MLESSQDGIRDGDHPEWYRKNVAVFRDAMSFDLKLGLWRIVIRHTRSQAGMRPSSIVMACPGFECLSDL